MRTTKAILSVGPAREAHTHTSGFLFNIPAVKRSYAVQNGCKRITVTDERPLVENGEGKID